MMLVVFWISGLALAASFALLYRLYAATAAENQELRRRLQAMFGKLLWENLVGSLALSSSAVR